MSVSIRDLELDQSLPSKQFGPITRTDIVRYAGASGDFNPVHHDEPLAIATGLPSVFSIGMLQAGVLAAYAADFFGPTMIRKYSARFKERVWPGDLLVCDGQVVDIQAEVEGHRVRVDLRCTNQDDVAVLDGSAEFVVPQ